MCVSLLKINSGQACKKDGFSILLSRRFKQKVGKIGMGIENPVGDASLHRPDSGSHTELKPIIRRNKRLISITFFIKKYYSLTPGITEKKVPPRHQSRCIGYTLAVAYRKFKVVEAPITFAIGS